MKEELNLKCRYKVYLDKTTSTYHFTTKNNIAYSVAFADYTNLLESALANLKLHKVYSLNLVKISDETEPLDLGVEKTMQHIVEHFFFLDKENSIVYLCDTSGHKGLKRFHKFNSWYEKSQNRKNYIKLNEYVDSIDENDNPIIHFTSLIYHKENPYKSSLESAYYSFIEDLRNK